MTDKELVRNLKAETYGRLTAMAVILLVLVCVNKCDRKKSEAIAKEEALKKTFVVPTRHDSIAVQNLFVPKVQQKGR